jgi:pyruvate/2-oxoglutarate/acetoin dehydrogenase E1 component
MRYVESINLALHRLLEADERVHVLGEDILDPYGGAFKATRGLSTKFPRRVLTTPISEPSIAGFCVGMATRGLLPVMEVMFGDFLTLCTDQIVNSATKFNWMYNEKVDVPLVIRTPMGGRRGYGATHSQTLETLFLNVAGLTIVAPSHFHDPGAALEAAVLKERSPLLFIENKLLYSQKLAGAGEDGCDTDFDFSEISLSDPRFPTISLLPHGESEADATLIVYGGMAPLAAQAVKNLYRDEEIVVQLLVPSLVKPFPVADVLASARATGKVLIAEEAVGSGGWGAALSSKIYSACFKDLSAPIALLGAKELPIPCSRPLEDQVLPQSVDIARLMVESFFQ